jgi:hypothetical protein
MLSLMGTLLVELSLPKLLVAWITLLVIPGLLARNRFSRAQLRRLP